MQQYQQDQKQEAIADLNAQPVSSWTDDRLTWLHHACQTGLNTKCDSTAAALTIRPCSKTDMWMRTHYSPPLLKCNAPVLGVRLPMIGWATAETQFSITPCHQFDQGGLCAYIDDNNWLKAGIEVVDGHPRVSVVVTNNGFSDWSMRSFPKLELSLRLHQRDDSFVVEVEHEDDGKKSGWEFIRIAHLSPSPCGLLIKESDEIGGERVAAAVAVAAAEANSIVMGVYACCPDESECAVRFSAISITPGSKFEHAN